MLGIRVLSRSIAADRTYFHGHQRDLLTWIPCRARPLLGRGGVAHLEPPGSGVECAKESNAMTTVTTPSSLAVLIVIGLAALRAVIINTTDAMRP